MIYPRRWRHIYLPLSCERGSFTHNLAAQEFNNVSFFLTVAAEFFLLLKVPYSVTLVSSRVLALALLEVISQLHSLTERET